MIQLHLNVAGVLLDTIYLKLNNVPVQLQLLLTVPLLVLILKELFNVLNVKMDML